MGNANLYDEIATLAYELYVKSGRVEGRDLDNWVEAEKIIKAWEEFCAMFMQMLVQNPLSARKLMEAIKLLVELEQKQQLENLIHSSWLKTISISYNI